MIIERPVEPDAVTAMENALNASKLQEPSVAMAPDVKDILRRYTEKLQQGHGQMPARRALSDPNKPAEVRQDAQRVNIDAGGGRSHISLIIGSDTSQEQALQVS
ncbi:hypothetical protein OSTOST_08371, partial [Ostertagia ostertagi]